MAESKKETSLVGQPKEKNSLLDLDFEKDDFLSSWKTLSVTEDDAMDLDFGPISKGKKKAFNFDKSDIDFNLDGDFGKIPSFNLDIPDIDLSSPVKKDGKPKERSSKDSTSGNTRGKADRFDFALDFDDLDGFNFKSSSKKEDVIVKGGEDKDETSNTMLSQKSRDCLAEDVDRHQFESNLLVSGSLITSKLDLQGDAGCSPELSNANSSSKSAKSDVGHLNSMVSTEEGASDKAMTLVKKTASDSNQESNFQLDQSTSPESLSQDVCIANENVQDKSVNSVLRNELSVDTVPEGQEEVSFRDKKACNLEKSANEKLIADYCEMPARSSSIVHDTAVTEKKKLGSQDQTHNDALVAVKGAEPVQGGTQVKTFLSTNASTDLVPKTQVDMKNQRPMELSSTPNSRTTANNLTPKKEREAVTRSKYFKQPDKTESQSQDASNQATCSSINDRVIGTGQSCPPDRSRKCNAIEAKGDTKSAGISLLHSGSVIGKEQSQAGNWENFREFKRNRSLDETVMIGKPVVSTTGGGKDVNSLHSFGSHINTKSLSGLTMKSSSQNSANPATLAMNLETCQNRKSHAGAVDKQSSVKATKQETSLSSLTTSRASGANLVSSKSPPHRDSMLSRDVLQYRNSAGSTLSKTIEVVPKKQTPTAPPLKRKIDEACSTDLILKPLKRLLDSPSSSNSAETSGKIVDGKAWDNENVADGKNKNVCKNQNNFNHGVPNQVCMKELEVPSSLDYDSNIEMADACSKGLEDICNLLSKKHEEAKELLVRAVVNNNRLLLLNHPIYEEKIRMVQKFAAQLTLREIHT